MRSRFKSGLSLLFGLLLIAATSQAAVCELVCGLGQRNLACHDSMGRDSKSMSPMSASDESAASKNKMAAMTDGHCGGARHMTPNAGRSFASFAATDGDSCRHLSGAAIEIQASVHAGLTAVHWLIVDILPIIQTRSSGHFLSSEAVARFSSGFDPLHISLRV